jgi:TPP-dependent pyruvate/acetoin dehydrogenase alpha subunit
VKAVKQMEPTPLDGAVAQRLYRGMLYIRLAEEAIADRYSQWKMRCPTHLCIGQEAVATGVCAALRASDLAVSGHRAHGHYLAKGGSLEKMIAEIYGKATGCCGGKGGSMHLVDLEAGFMGSTAIVGGTIPIGVGLGLSLQLSGVDDISVVFLGDGAVEEGVFYESANFAALRKLPVLFVCENNLYSVYSPLSVRQPQGRRIHEMVAALGVPSAHVDGNDVVSVHDASRVAVERIRAGDGPQFLEFETYRWREHCGPNFDNDIGYRLPEEFEAWKTRDPLVLARRRFVASSWLDSAMLAQMTAEVGAQIESAFDFAERSPFPEPLTAFDHVVAD